LRFLHHNGRNVRSDRPGTPVYPYERGAKNRWRVSTWKKSRFALAYPGFDCDVLDGDRDPVHGGTILSSVRHTYFEQ
jgi:hypothetical protein